MTTEERIAKLEGAHDNLATKADVESLRADLNGQTGIIKEDITKSALSITRGATRWLQCPTLAPSSPSSHRFMNKFLASRSPDHRASLTIQGSLKGSVGALLVGALVVASDPKKEETDHGKQTNPHLTRRRPPCRQLRHGRWHPGPSC